MRWLALHLPRLAIEALAPADDTPSAVHERIGPRRVIVAVNDSAAAKGIGLGMPVPQAQALVPALRLVGLDRRLETATLRRLAVWAMQYTSVVHLPQPPPEAGAGRLLLEIGGSVRLFGGKAALVERAVSGLSALGYTAWPGVAQAPKAALLLARTPDVVHLEDAPLERLELPDETLATLRASGLRTVGEVLQLPRASLGRRFGPSCLDYLARLAGDKADPLDVFQPPRRYRARVAFDAEVENTQALRFPLRRLVGELAGGLRGLDATVQAIALRLAHARHEPTDVRLHLSQPTRAPERLLALLDERLERLQLPAPVRALRLASGPYLRFAARQHDLFDYRARDSEALAGLLDRLKARLGEEAVCGLQVQADHRPEHASRLGAGPHGQAAPTAGERPVWLFEAPQPLSGPPDLLTGPERIESGWWEADVARDYYVARAPDGRRLWICRERRPPHRWYLHGLFG